jgi:hypothetical protein
MVIYRIDCQHTLAKFREKGANIRLYLYELGGGKTEVEDAKGVPNHLLHSKVFLFDQADNTAFAWIGSHNGTFRALQGINLECSNVIHLDKKSQQYADIEQHLNGIERVCRPFYFDEISEYQALQGFNAAEPTIEVVVASHTPLDLRSEITIFGSVARDFQELKTVDKELFLAVTDSATDTETFYKAEISQTGKSPGQIRFSARRYAMRHGEKIPELQPSGSIPESIYKNAAYFVTLSIKYQMPDNTVGFEAVNPRDCWEVIPEEAVKSLSVTAGGKLESFEKSKLFIRGAAQGLRTRNE